MEKQKHRWIIPTAAAVAVAVIVAGGALWAQAPARPAGPGAAVLGAGSALLGQGGMMGRGLMGQGRMMGPGRGRMGGPLDLGPGFLGGRLARLLDLTEAQRQEIRATLDSYRDEAAALAAKAQPLHQQVREAVVANNPAAIDALAPELGQLAAEQAKLRARVHAEVFAKLTPEQQQKIKEFEEQARTRVGQFRQGQPGGRR